MHPMRTTAWAHRTAMGRLVAVQHHHATPSPCSPSTGGSTPMIAVTYDGTGCSLDGTIWAANCSPSRTPPAGTRVRHLRPVRAAGRRGTPVAPPGRIALDRAGPASALGRRPGAGGRRRPGRPAHLAQRVTRGLGCVTTQQQGPAHPSAVASQPGVCLPGDLREPGRRRALEHWPTPGATPRWTSPSPRGVLDPSAGESAPVWSETHCAASCRSRGPAAARLPRREPIRATAAARPPTRPPPASPVIPGRPGGGLRKSASATRDFRAGLTQEAASRVLSHRTVPCNDGELALGQATIADRES